MRESLPEVVHKLLQVGWGVVLFEELSGGLSRVGVCSDVVCHVVTLAEGVRVYSVTEVGEILRCWHPERG